jgi:hypothetical protein
MTPDAALQLQIQRYRAMTGQERLKIALDLHEFACDVARAGIRRQFAEADAEEVERQLRRRIQLSSLGWPGLEAQSIGWPGLEAQPKPRSSQQ